MHPNQDVQSKARTGPQGPNADVDPTPSKHGSAPRRLNRFAVWVILMPLALLLLAACVAFATGMATAPDTHGVDTAPVVSGPIDPASYTSVDPDVQALAATPAAGLYAQYLDGAPDAYTRLDDRQRAAVAAAWQHYLQDPSDFAGPESRAYYMRTFDSYLLALGHATGDRQPLIDRGRLQLANHESLARQRWSDASIMFPDDPLLEALATEHSLPGKAWHWVGRGVFHWADRLGDTPMVDQMLSQ